MKGHPRNMVTYTVMAMYAIPWLALVMIDAREGFVRFREGPKSFIILSLICMGVVALGFWIISGDNRNWRNE